MNVIRVEHLTRDYGGGKGVFDASFQVSQGEVFGFLGPNGAGKTTTIRHLMGFLRPQAGSCRIDGMGKLEQTGDTRNRHADLRYAGFKRRRLCGYLFLH